MLIVFCCATMIDCRSSCENSTNFGEYACHFTIEDKSGFLENVASFSFDRVEIGAKLAKAALDDKLKDGGRRFDRSSNRRMHGDNIVGTQLVSGWRAHDVENRASVCQQIGSLALAS